MYWDQVHPTPRMPHQGLIATLGHLPQVRGLRYDVQERRPLLVLNG